MYLSLRMTIIPVILAADIQIHQALLCDTFTLVVSSRGKFGPIALAYLLVFHPLFFAATLCNSNSSAILSLTKLSGSVLLIPLQKPKKYADTNGQRERKTNTNATKSK
jgi:hypothetical protein